VTEPAIPSVDVHVGDVSHSQLVFGDHNTIQTPQGTKVTVLQVGDRPVARLRAMPVASRPTARVEIVGRDEQLRLAASATSDAPVQLYAPGGAGKTALLQSVAQETATPPEGVVFAAVRRRTLDDIQAKLYTAFWESDVPFLPGPAEVGGFLADREALLVLDDCGLDRDDLDALLDSVGRCTVVTASGERTLWSRGTARALHGLDPAAAVKVLERELGHAIQAEERSAAEAVVARLNGHPQSLVETAALIADGRASIRELADDPAALERRTDPSALSSSQRHILEVLGALGSAPLNVEHVSALAAVRDAGRELTALERRGWVKSASPRYRLVRPLPDGFAALPEQELADRLLGHLAGWSREARPTAVADEAEAVEASLDLALGTQNWEGALALARASEGKLAVAGSWTRWGNVLTSGLTAARALGDQTAEGYLLHQLGSRLLCLGTDETAVTQLEEALGIRERLGDHDGAELTRHNLRQVGGGGPGHGAGGGGGGGGPWRPRLRVALAALAVVAAAIIALVLAISGGGSTNAVPAGQTGKAAPAATGASTPATPTPRRPGAPPSITIVQPKDGATFTAQSVVPARYTCTVSEGAQLQSCRGPVADGESIDTSSGSHEFTVTASDNAGHSSKRTVTYREVVVHRPRHVSNPQSTDKVPPSIDIAVPKNTDSFNQSSTVLADYGCTDEEGGSGLASCDGTAPSGQPIDTSTKGDHTFIVTARDKAGNEFQRKVTYSVSSG
jgi:hypothetical protein